MYNLQHRIHVLMSEFQWPWQYSFPPFYTLQPNTATRKNQLEAWCSLVLSYAQHHKIYSFDVTEVQQSSLFNNSNIKRRLSTQGVLEVFEQLEKTGHLEWVDKQKRRCHIYWRRPEEWAKIIYDWVITNSFRNTVCTFYELIESEESSGEAFYALEKDILLKALKVLEAQSKAEIIHSEEGVKFL